MSAQIEQTQIFGLSQAWRDSKERQERKLAEANAATLKTVKLSDLQRQILEVGVRWRGLAPADIYVADIKTEIFDLEPTRRERLIPGTARLAASERQYNVPYGYLFDVHEIGERKYNAICASISRALKRLERRKLIVVKGPGRVLTNHGLEVLKVRNG